MTDVPNDENVHHEYVTFVCGCCGDKLIVPVSCGNRFCPVCTKSRRSRLQKRVKHIMSNVELAPNHTYKFLTLSVTNMSNPAEQLKLLQKSFRRLRQRKWWKNHVKGGCVFYEVKLGTDKKYHIHIHAVIESAYLPWAELKELWTSVSGGSATDIKKIDNPGVIRYITKYTTKSELPLKHQLIASKLLKGTRLFQPFGSWHSIGLKYEHKAFECSHCEISDWHFLPSHMTVYEVMWSKAHHPRMVPDRIVKEFQYELGLKVYQLKEKPSSSVQLFDRKFDDTDPLSIYKRI